MNKEIIDAITKSLPAMQVEVLNQELKKAGEYETLKLRFEDLNKEASKYLDTITRLTKQIKSEEELSIREAAISDRERRYELEILKKDAQCSKDTLVAVRDLAMAAFRNPTVYKSYNKPMEIQSGNYINQVTENETISTD